MSCICKGYEQDELNVVRLRTGYDEFVRARNRMSCMCIGYEFADATNRMS